MANLVQTYLTNQQYSQNLLLHLSTLSWSNWLDSLSLIQKVD